MSCAVYSPRFAGFSAFEGFTDFAARAGLSSSNRSRCAEVFLAEVFAVLPADFLAVFLLLAIWGRGVAGFEIGRQRINCQQICHDGVHRASQPATKSTMSGYLGPI